jgi:GTPase
VAVMGSADAGKSTLLGVLTQGQPDNGRGRARLNMFRHLHEVQSGRTSSISHEILGFDTQVSVTADSLRAEPLSGYWKHCHCCGVGSLQVTDSYP